MDIIHVIMFEDQLVVDSRLIATNLKIEHESFLKTIKNYKPQTEQAFGAIRFEIGSRSDGNTGGKQPEWALLNEDQATFLMTLSRNTSEVVNCKLKLVKAFSLAKKQRFTKPVPTQEQQIEHRRLLIRLEFVQRLIDRMDLKVQFVDLFDFIKEWKDANPQEFVDDKGKFRDRKYDYYEASIVNSAYTKLYGNNKKLLCEKLGIPYENEITIRNYMPVDAMQAMLCFEAHMRSLVKVLGEKPTDALPKAFAMLRNDMQWRSTDFPMRWEKQKSIATPPSWSAEQFKNRYLQERDAVNLKLADYARVFVFGQNSEPLAFKEAA
ncbi:MAG: Rha family transcriptional regulator [Rhizonema sp. NSF051]|nr:Rha family transcriptional regulator [Rhizonema sp. NSF051]